MAEIKSETKNYNSCPLKKRPVFYDPVIKEEPEQDEPVNLCVRKVNKDEYVNKMVRTITPLKDITSNIHQERVRYAAAAATHKIVDENRHTFVKQEQSLYNLLPGYSMNYSCPAPASPPQSASSIKSEPEYWHRETSVSPPTHLYKHHHLPSPPPPSAPQMKITAVHSPQYSHEQYYHQSENHHLKSESAYPSKSHRFVPYHVSRQHHIVDDYHSSMSPTHSHSSLNSLGASSRSSMSPASTSSSITEDSYHMLHAQNTANSISITKPMSYESNAEHSVIMKTDLPRYQCSDCSKSYSTYSGLTKHKQFHCTASPNNQAKKSFDCQFCPKTYTSMGALKMHIRTHTKPCKCHLCGKAFSRPWLLQGHIRTHTGDKPFECQHCNRAFADKSNLRAHLQTHSEVKKYPCKTCSKTFSRNSLLMKHEESGCPGLMASQH